MKKLFLLKTITIASALLLFVGCSSNKPATTAITSELPPDTAATSGMSTEGGFGETTTNDVHTVCHPSIGKDHYYFDLDQDTIHEDDMASLKNQITYLVAHSNTTVRVEGNTDERGSKEYNIALGYRRAKAVARVLEQAGVAHNKIKIVSYGEEKPISVGHDENSWQCNRRVDLVYGDN